MSQLPKWSREDVQSFLALDVECTPTPRTNLLSRGLLGGFGVDGGTAGSAFAQGEEERLKDEKRALIEKAWAARRAHPVYRSLRKNREFLAAWDLFERRRKGAKEGPLTSDTCSLVFLREFAQFAWFARTWPKPEGKKRSGANARRRHSAMSHASKLVELIGLGVRIDDYAANQTLLKLLNQLNDQLRSTRRKEYGGERENERWALRSLAFNLVMYFRLKSPAILTHYARMVGYQCEEKTARRYLLEAESRWSGLVAASLSKARGSAALGQQSAKS